MSIFAKTKEYTVYIDGMRCSHCAANVEKTLKELKGIKKVSVDLEGKKANISASTNDENALFAEIKANIATAGFEVTKIE